jgi:hypothetical protein
LHSALFALIKVNVQEFSKRTLEWQLLEGFSSRSFLLVLDDGNASGFDGALFNLGLESEGFNESKLLTFLL